MRDPDPSSGEDLGLDSITGVIEALPLPAFYKNRSLQYVACNQEFCEFLGLSRESILGRTPEAVAPASLASAYFDMDRKLLASPGVQRYESQIRHADGSLRDVEFFKRTVTGTDGTVRGILGVVFDVTAKKILTNRIEFLTSAVAQMPDALVITDNDTRIVYVNPAFERITGYSASEALGRNPRIMKSGRQHPWFYQELWRTILAGQVWRGRLINRRKDGTEYLEDSAISPVMSNSGERIGYFAIKRDVTEEAEQEDFRATAAREAALGRLAREIAHDFNNVLTVVMGAAQLPAGREPSAEQTRGRFQKIVAAGERGAAMVRRLMAMSRGEAAERVPMAVARLLGEGGEFLRDVLPNTLKVHVEAYAGSERIMADSVEFNQILLNLATNARDALQGKPGVVSIGARSVHPEDRPQVEFSFADSGPGMDEDTRSRIFEPFFSTRGGGKNFGIGLATVKRIVTEMQGSIDVSSEPGRGTVFHLRFPVVSPE